MSLGAFFVPSRVGLPARSMLERENAMGCSRAPASSDAQPYSDPDAAGAILAGWLSDPLIERQHDGTPARAWASTRARPVGSRLIPLLDNRRCVQRRQVGQRDRRRPTTASSHSARYAAAGRRSGWLTSQSCDQESLLIAGLDRSTRSAGPFGALVLFLGDGAMRWERLTRRATGARPRPTPHQKGIEGLEVGDGETTPPRCRDNRMPARRCRSGTPWGM